MLNVILPRSELVIATQSLHPRAATPTELKKFLSEYDIEAITEPTIEEAMAKAISLAGGSKGILVTGSLFIAAGARATWHQVNY